MKKWSVFIILLFLLSGCTSTQLMTSSIIDWTDFIKWDGKNYSGIYSGVLADDHLVGEKIGMVKFEVADHVTDPGYKTKDGDAAFHKKGTQIFKLKGQPHFLAVKSSRAIHGYEVYFSDEDSRYRWTYEDMPAGKVKRIEIHQAYQGKSSKLLNTLTKVNEVKSFLQLLEKGKTKPDFQPKTQKKDPLVYEMVFYTGEPIAYKYDLVYDGRTYFWSPNQTDILSDEISGFVSSKD